MKDITMNGINMETLLKEIQEYHDWHGDLSAQFVRFVGNGTGLLVRIKDACGRSVSVIHGFDPSRITGDYDIHELDYTLRSGEKQMVASFEHWFC